MKNLLITLLFLSICSLASTQTCKLTGRLIDMASKKPIPYANAILKSPTDSTVFKGTITNDTGGFTIKGIKGGQYNLKLSFIGYQSVVIDKIRLQRGLRDMGVIELKVLSENIKEVVVRATPPSISYKVDKKVINAGSFPGASVAMDLLENIPSLQVDFEGKLTYRGDGTFSVFINGQAVSNGEEKLRQIPSDRIDKIEVITNPSAKYDAEGTAGIINVILKKNRLKGYAINTTARASTYGDYRLNYSINKQSDRGGWYLEGNMNHRVWEKSNVVTDRKNVQGENIYIVHSDLDLRGEGNQNYTEFGFNYDLTDKDCIDFNINGNILASADRNTKEGEILEILERGSAIVSNTSYHFDGEYKYDYQYVGSAFKYEHAFTKDREHLFSASVNYSSYLNPFNEKLFGKKQYTNSLIREGLEGKEYNETIVNAKIGYQNKLSENTSFEIGAKLNTDHIPKVISESGTFDEEGNLTPFPNNPLNQEVDFKQDVYSAYASLKSAWGKFEYQLGLRNEWTERQSNYKYQSVEGQAIRVPAEKSFTDLFPSIHAVYNFSETHQLAASYSKRVKRPQYWHLIPILSYDSPYSNSRGNGNLMPSYTHAFEMAYKKSWDKDFVGVEVFARNTQDVIQEFSRTDMANVLINTRENVGESWSIGTELMLGIDLYNWWNLNISSALYSYRLDVDIDEFKKKESQFSTDSRMNNSFTLPKNFILKWDVKYQSPGITAQSKRDGYCYSNLALKKSFKDNQWQLMLSWWNVFNSFKYKSVSDGVDFNIKEFHNRKPYLSFKLTYSFNNQK